MVIALYLYSVLMSTQKCVKVNVGVRASRLSVDFLWQVPW